MLTSKEKYFREMTVAHIREGSSPDYVEIIFLDSARFYTLKKDHPEFGRILSLLIDALSKKKAVKVYLSSLESDIIENVSE